MKCDEYIYYEIYQIGIGSFSKVFCGYHKPNDYFAAIKVPNTDINQSTIDMEIKYTKMLEKEPGFPLLFKTYSLVKYESAETLSSV